MLRQLDLTEILGPDPWLLQIFALAALRLRGCLLGRPNVAGAQAEVDLVDEVARSFGHLRALDVSQTRAVSDSSLAPLSCLRALTALSALTAALSDAALRHIGHMPGLKES